MTLQILLTNDDGIHAPGLAVLRDAVDGLGEITTIAPDHNASAVARGITIDRPLRLAATTFGESWPGLACDGTPSDCVRIGLLGVRGPAPDLVVSGVNCGANMGADVTYSGTVGAALEAALRGRPALAFSVESRAPRWLAETAPVLRAMVERVIARGLPRHSILNVNFPDRPLDAIAGIRPARLGGASCWDRVFLSADGDAPLALADAGELDADSLGQRLRVFRALRPSHGRGVGRHRLRRGRPRLRGGHASALRPARRGVARRSCRLGSRPGEAP